MQGTPLVRGEKRDNRDRVSENDQTTQEPSKFSCENSCWGRGPHPKSHTPNLIQLLSDRKIKTFPTLPPEATYTQRGATPDSTTATDNAAVDVLTTYYR